MATLCEVMSDIVASVKIMMLVIGNSLLEHNALEQKGKVKILEPMPYAREQDA